jgi:hypothetical protein
MQKYIRLVIEGDDAAAEKQRIKVTGKAVSQIPGTRLVFDIIDFADLFTED